MIVIRQSLNFINNLLLINQQTNEKVYLLKQMNDEWMLGRNKRGCEGIFPISYVDVRVPLKQVEPDSGTASRSASVSPATEGHRIRSLYNFNAETDEDLSIKVRRHFIEELRVHN